MTAITAALHAGLDNVYAKFGENGVMDIGLQSALDVGVRAANYVQVPRSCIKGATAGQGVQLDSIANGPSGCRVGRCDPVVISDKWTKYKYRGAEIPRPTQAGLTSAELGLLAIANFRAAVAAGWEERHASLVASAHVMAFLLGVLESEGEWVIVTDPDVTNLNAREVAFLNDFEEIANSGSSFVRWVLSITTPSIIPRDKAAFRVSPLR